MLFLLSFCVVAQKFFTKTGITEFKASVVAFEPVEAKNKSTSAILNTENGQIAALLFIKAFQFRVALMQEHFNENYMDSNTFPKATFKGEIEGFSLDLLSKKKGFPLKGMLSIRGKSKVIDTQISIKKKGENLLLESSFSVSPKDFDIEIPTIVKKKISESINIILSYEMVQKK